MPRLARDMVMRHETKRHGYVLRFVWRLWGRGGHANLCLQVGADRIMFSADYPFSAMPAARAFLEQLPVSPADKERIAHENAERLLAL